MPIIKYFRIGIVQICNNFLEADEEQRLKKRKAMIERATAPVVPRVYRISQSALTALLWRPRP